MESDANEDHQNQHSKLDQPSRKPPPNGGGGGSGDKLKRNEWSEGAVSCLLEAYEAKWVLRNRAKHKGKDWEDVARHVSSRANNTKTQIQCKNKTESMKKWYRSESATSDTSSWPLFLRLDHLIRGTGGPPPPHSHPTLLDSSVVTLPLQPPTQLSPIEIAQRSQVSNGVDPMANKDQDGGGETKLSDQVSDKIPNHQYHTPGTDSNNDREEQLKLNNNVMNTKRKKRRRTTSSEDGSWDHMAESIRWLAEAVVKCEQSRMDTIRETERMRVEEEAKRGEMDVKRSEIIANTQLEIARLFASTLAGKGV